MICGKVLLNLEAKLARLDEKLVEAYDQNNNTEAAEQFQNILDEDTKFTH